MSDVEVDTKGMGPSWPVMSIAEAHARLTAGGARFEMETVDVRGVPTRVWKNAPLTLRDVFVHLDGYAERTCLVYGDERATYEGFMHATLELAQQLRAAGVQRGDRVAIAMRNLPEWPVCMFAATLLGAIVVPCNAWGSGAELEYAISFAGAVALCVDGERLERLAPHLAACPSLRALFVTRTDAAQLAAAETFRSQLAAGGLRAQLSTEESLSRRVAEAHANAVPYVVVIGAREAAADSVSLRERNAQRELSCGAALAELIRLCARPRFVA